jgi:hypothetical protein
LQDLIKTILLLVNSVIHEISFFVSSYMISKSIDRLMDYKSFHYKHHNKNSAYKSVYLNISENFLASYVFLIAYQAQNRNGNDMNVIRKSWIFCKTCVFNYIRHLLGDEILFIVKFL